MNELLFDPAGKPTVNLNKATELMDRLLILQYANKPNIREYFLAFVEELDFLFAEIEEVYLGRFLEFAQGDQLDIIGIILDESRSVNLPTQFFGFNDNLGGVTENVAPMADEVLPSDGGIFLSEGQEGYTNVPLSDLMYRRLLLAKAMLSTRDECTVNNAYNTIMILLGKSPKILRVTSGTRSVLIELSQADTTISDQSIVSYFSRYLTPLGTSLAVNRVLL